MNFKVYLMTIIFLVFTEVNCRSIPLASGALSGIEDEISNLGHGSSGKFSWIKLKPILHRELQRVRNVKGMVDTLSMKTAPQIHLSEKEAITDVNEIASKTGLHMTSDTVKYNLPNNDQIFEEITEEGISGISESMTSTVEMLKMNISNSNDFPYNITPDVLTHNGDLIVFLAVNDNVTKTESMESNEVLLPNEGHLVAFEGDSPTAVELLTEFETKQSSFQTGLPETETILTNENDFNLTVGDLNITNFNNNSHENKSEKQTDEEPVIINTDVISTIKIETEIPTFNLSNSTHVDTLTEVSNLESSKCPDPGLCIFWFFALDTCAKDSHCHGSLICCTWGCSKTCMDVDGELP